MFTNVLRYGSELVTVESYRQNNFTADLATKEAADTYWLGYKVRLVTSGGGYLPSDCAGPEQPRHQHPRQRRGQPDQPVLRPLGPRPARHRAGAVRTGAYHMISTISIIFVIYVKYIIFKISIYQQYLQYLHYPGRG